MSSYNAKVFSKDFSKRTQKNLDYITKAVHKKELKADVDQGLLSSYSVVIENLNDSADKLLKDAQKAPNQKVLYQRFLRRAANNLQEMRSKLETLLNEIDSADEMSNQPLYEVTQTINSLMGIAVLPYEMHKDYLWRSSIDGDAVTERYAYQELRRFISDLYGGQQCRSTYNDDHYSERVNWRVVVSFLRHVRNVACHSGDDALCILPLDNGTDIQEILFYDRKEESNEKFVMRLSIEEVNELVRHIAHFYSIPEIGDIDSSESIKAAKRAAEDFLYYGK